MRIFKLFRDSELIGVIKCKPDIIDDVAYRLGANEISIPHLPREVLDEVIDGYRQMRGI